MEKTQYFLDSQKEIKEYETDIDLLKVVHATVQQLIVNNSANSECVVELAAILHSTDRLLISKGVLVRIEKRKWLPPPEPPPPPGYNDWGQNEK